MPPDPSSDEVLEGGPPSGGPLNLPSPIGVPPTYTAQRYGTSVEGTLPGEARIPGIPHGPATTTLSVVPPTFFDGDQYLPASMPPDQIAALQRALIDAGLISKTATVRLGVWDNATRQAYETLLGYANAAGFTNVKQALDSYTRNAQSTVNETAPLTVRVSNPDDLRSVFRQAVIDALGTGWDQGRIDAMVSAYQALERGDQTQAAAMAETGGSMVAPPSPQAFAEAQAEQADPTAVQGQRFLGAADQFFDLIGGWNDASL